MNSHATLRCSAPSSPGYDAGRFTLSVLPSVLRLTWRHQIVIDHVDVARVGRAITASAHRGLPLLVQVSALREVTCEARQAVLGYSHPARIALLGSDDVDLVLTAFMVRAPSETRFFTDQDDAVRWLLQP
ncbi:hypothetical protein PTW37_06955 [Arthrobacter agilis]|uniref:DUF7793 family protein n=1 Tax=Arthrobacter agilis TaxID=37921 RepID=UPI002365F813|nr:hypothetical protein [Arthrobacter agilis]WDF34628.1 hypothetical protein PTW37_06955 [Arthrobacter agilis]